VVAGLVGLVAFAAGGALTVSYAGTGLALRPVSGVLALVGGVTAVVLGLVALMRSMRGWHRLPVVAVAVYMVGFPLAVAVYATNVGRPELGRLTPANHGIAYVDVAFVSDDGVRLSGWYIPSTNGAVVVLLHGASSTRSSVLDQAAVLARHGYGVLLYDARGMGRSGGRAMNLGWYGDRDMDAAIDFLATRSDIDAQRIAALGESMGGEEAIGAMAADQRLRAVVAEGATNRVAADWGWLADQYGGRGRLQQGVQWLTYQLTDLLTDAHPPISLRDAVADANRPVLLITAGNVTDETNAARYIKNGAPSYVEIWTVPGANHTSGLRTQPGEWEHRVTSFLDEALR
jgi:pimeloyl-ACP methyl ester carboxylesterase